MFPLPNMTRIRYLFLNCPCYMATILAKKSVELKHRGILSKIKGKNMTQVTQPHFGSYYKGQLIIDQNVIKEPFLLIKGMNSNLL